MKYRIMKLLKPIIKLPGYTPGYYGRWQVLCFERLNQHQYTIHFGRREFEGQSARYHVSIDRRGRGSRWGYEVHNTARYPRYAQPDPHAGSPHHTGFSFWFTNPRVHRWYAFHVYVYLPHVFPLSLLPNHRYAYSKGR
jgi:hypothetical protein